ncbi:MAG TPA: nucleotide exchange factor GrpE [Phycisphaerae bacterium]|nr:nucleotide exchange factor GrpE [Phycisphaerae bacterium]
MAEQWRLALVAPSDEAAAAESAADLHTLLAELIALKQEVRLEARGGKTARAELDQAVGEFRQGVDHVQQQAQRLLDPLVRERDQLRDEMNDQLEAQRRSWLELLLDVREALVRGEETSGQAARRLGWRRWFVPRGLLDGLLEGYRLASRRIDGALDARGVRPIECVGQPVDPERMRVVDVVQSDSLPEGRVVEVVRCGYTCKEKVIRYAEVRAVVRRP